MLADWLLRSLEHRVFLSPATLGSAGVSEGLAAEYLRRSRHLFVRSSSRPTERELTVPTDAWAVEDAAGRLQMLPYQLRCLAAECLDRLAAGPVTLSFEVRREALGRTDPFMPAVRGMLPADHPGLRLRLRVV